MSTSSPSPNESGGSDVVVEIADAKARLFELIRRAEAGERVTIARGTKAVAELRPVTAQRSPIGLYKEISGPTDMAALHAALDVDWSPDDLDDFEGDLERELRSS